MKNNVFLTNDDIIEVVVAGDQDEASVIKMGDQIKKLVADLQKQSKPVYILDDVVQIGTVDHDARSVVVELGKTLPYDRLALLGKPGLMRFGTNLMMRAMNKADKIEYFDDRAKAVEWLHKG